MKKSRTISDFMLERYLLQELPKKDMQTVEAAVNEQVGVKKRLNSLKKSNQEILQSYPSNDIVAEIQRRLTIENDLRARTQKKTGFVAVFKKWYFFPALAASCAILVIMIVLALSGKNINQKQLAKENNKQQDDIIKEKNYDRDLINKNKKPLQLAHNYNIPYYGLKGFKTEIIVHRKKGAVVEMLKNGTVAKERDLIQLAYQLEKKSYGVILSIDGKGSVTVHYPLNANYSAKLLPGKKVNLPTAFELDDAPYFERFFLITADKNFSINYVKSAAKKLAGNAKHARKANLPITKTLKQVSILIIKGK